MSTFNKHIIFCKNPLKTQFSYKDILQIYPLVSDNAPYSKHSILHPIILEFVVDEKEKSRFNSAEFMAVKEFLQSSTDIRNKSNRLIRLLSSLTNYRFFMNESSESGWSMEMPEIIDEKINQKKSIWTTSLFYYPNMSEDLKGDDFTDKIFPEIKLKPYYQYFTRVDLDNHKKEIVFPDVLEKALESYFNLDTDKIQVIDCVTYLICCGIDLRLKMKSMSFLAFVSAIETLVNYEYKEENKKISYACHDCQKLSDSPFKCPKCGAPVWAVKRKFREFLSKYVHPSNGSISKYNKIYNLRSNITHNGNLLLKDHIMEWYDTAKTEDQFITYFETMQLSKLALINWLIQNSASS